MTKYPYDFDDNTSIPSVTPSAGGPTGPTGPTGAQGPKGERGFGNWTDTIPTTSSDPGVVGQFTGNTNYIYICIATNTWVRVATTAW